MNKRILPSFSLSLLWICVPSYAALVLNGTRYIYEEGISRKEITISNKSERTMGAQIWIEPFTDINSKTGYSGESHFTASPALVKIAPKGKANVNIVSITDNLPQEHESIYWLNVQEIPPKSEVDAPSVVFAQRIKVKMIYRPKALGNRYSAEEKLLATCNQGVLQVVNKSPFLFSPLYYSLGKENVAYYHLIMPGTNNILSKVKDCPKEMTINMIDDFGGKKDYKVNVNGK
ncbi:hypothetical protein BOO92_18100 [Vibrio navarrensis]|uniref:fimbria/pilus periplasmic chaperone n=1 Tax=Vibrio navarrensis TaxID=29495 RepID=UPI00186808FF|nr:fimbria/pilus periplasmic chaperone [Vibrio navarrensis]MBE3658594.1 hypothetical protein [Vibrio navarrensis]